MLQPWPYSWVGRSPWALFFIFGCATSVAQVALLSMLTYYSSKFGRQTFVGLTCATYLPSLPVVLLQSQFDRFYDGIFSTAVAFKFRVTVSFLVLTVTMCALPLMTLDKEWELLTCAAVVGIFTGVIFGSFYQLLTFIHAEDQTRNTAFFAFGYQGSGVLVLVLSLAAFHGHQDSPSTEMLRQFFFSVAVVPLLALALFMTLAASEHFIESARLRDVTVSRGTPELLLGSDNMGAEEVTNQQLERDQALLRSQGGEHVGTHGEENIIYEEIHGESDLSQMQILQRCFPCAACIFVTIFASKVVFPFYTFVPSSNPMFPMILFYIKVGKSLCALIWRQQSLCACAIL